MHRSAIPRPPTPIPVRPSNFSHTSTSYICILSTLRYSEGYELMRWFDQWDTNKKNDRKKGLGPRDASTRDRLHEDAHTLAADKAALNGLMATYLMQVDE